MVPVAVGRTAVAVGGLADSWVVLRLTRSRLWIGLLGILLVGIVGLNVMALSLNAASSRTAGISDELRRENSALRAQIADGLSNERLQQAAARLGLIMPEAAATLMLEPGAGDAEVAAERLRKGRISIGALTPAVPAAVATPIAPASGTTTEPAAVPPAPAPVEPVEPATEAPASASTPAAPPAVPPAGGVVAP